MGKGSKGSKATDGIADRAIASMSAALARKVPSRIDHALVLDYRLADAVLFTRKDYEAAVMSLGRQEAAQLPTEEAEAKRDEAKAALDAAEAELDDATLVVWFEALGGEEMELLMAKHLPTKEQHAELRRQLLAQGLPANERLQYNSETFPPAIIAACSADPVITEDEAKEFWLSQDISRGERAKMLEAAYKVNDIVR